MRNISEKGLPADRHRLRKSNFPLRQPLTELGGFVAMKLQRINEWQRGRRSRLRPRWVHQDRHLTNALRQTRHPIGLASDLQIPFAPSEKIESQRIRSALNGIQGIREI